MDVRDFLEFECAFERGRKAVPASKVEEISGVLELFGDRLDGLGRLEHGSKLIGQVVHRLRKFTTSHDGEIVLAGQLEREECEGDHLTGERLRARDADLGSGVEVHAAVVFAGDRGADDVHESKRARPPSLGLTHGRERVRRLARLRHHDTERPIGHNGILVPELRRILDFDGDATKLFNHHFADERRVPRRSARGDDHVVDVQQLVVRKVEPAEFGRAIVENQAPAHRVLDARGLLEDLLQHEVVEPAAFDLGEIPVNTIHLARHRRGVGVNHPIRVLLDDRHIAVVEIDHLAGVREDR